jgi:IS1 family transposase
MNLERVPLIATDGFQFYKRVVRRILGPACLYGQVIKTRRNDRIIKVERRILIGDTWRFEEMLRDSEDSSKLNTSFVERVNLTIRQGSAYLFRRTIYHARWKEHLEDHLELLRCYYNFVRPHMALKFGREMRTPAIQAGLTARRLTLREIFPAAMLLSFSDKVKFGESTVLVVFDEARNASGSIATIDDGSTSCSSHRSGVCCARLWKRWGDRAPLVPIASRTA